MGIYRIIIDEFPRKLDSMNLIIPEEEFDPAEIFRLLSSFKQFDATENEKKQF